MLFTTIDAGQKDGSHIIMRVFLYQEDTMSNNSLDKPFKTFQEQISILNKRMTTDTNTVYYLMRNNYYSIINFYKEPFIVNRKKEIYRHKTHFNDLRSLMEFDRDLRLLFFNYLTQLERTIKTLIAYHFSKFYGKNSKESYLDKNNYSLTSKTEPNIIELIDRLNEINNNYQKYLVIAHYKNKNNIPFWVTIHFLSFGQTSMLFSLLLNNVKKLIVNNFKDLYFHEYNKLLTIDHHFLRTFLKSCTEFRNAAGHNERFYDYKIRDSLNIKNTTGISSDRSNLFSIYEGLKFFLPKREYEKLTENLKILISNLEKNLNTDWESNINKYNPLPINNILKLMNFPNDWHK